MNAIPAHILQTDPADETAEEQKRRHLRTCQELIELGMDLAREAAHHARADMAAPPPGRIPGSAAAAIERAEDRARRRTPSYAIVFTRLSRAVRQTIALQAHITAGYPMPHPARAASPGEPPARGTPRTEGTTHPDRPATTRDEVDRPDWSFTLDPSDKRPIDSLLQTIREDLNLAPCADREPDPPASARKPRAHPSLVPAVPPETWRPPAGDQRSD